MPKKIECIEIRRYVYEPELEESSVYTEHDITTVEDAMELDKKDVASGDTTLHDITDGYYEVKSREWRIVDEP